MYCYFTIIVIVTINGSVIHNIDHNGTVVVIVITIVITVIVVVCI